MKPDRAAKRLGAVIIAIVMVAAVVLGCYVSFVLG